MQVQILYFNIFNMNDSAFFLSSFGAFETLTSTIKIYSMIWKPIKENKMGNEDIIRRSRTSILSNEYDIQCNVVILCA